MNLKFPPAFLLLPLFPALGAGQSRKVTRPVSNYPADVPVGEAELEVRRSQLVHRVAVAPNGVVAVERRDRLAVLLGRRPVRHLAQSLSDLPPDHDGPIPRLRASRRPPSLRSWRPVCGIRNPKWIPP
jgi:hypothetical protein